MYSIQLNPAALKDYHKIPKNIILKINSSIDSLKINPRPTGYKKLKNRNAYRIRVGDYRIIYEIKDKELLIIVIRLRHRREVYREL